ncbi:MAG: insulinase family protein [Christensenellaceae bacterium]|jgi:predicted Zn-dependent peptidase|nr:insulinase family protein [Christensenellaceae bacterium]
MKEVKEKVYPSGLRLLTQEMPNFSSVSIAVLVKVGSKNEIPSEEGLSHFVEHMLFKGTTTRTSEDIAKTLSNEGVDYNAWTSSDSTCYHTRGLIDNAPVCMDILSDMYFNLKFPDDDFEREAEVICQEIAMHNDNPRSALYELAGSTYFKGTQYEHPIAGTAKQIKGYKPSSIYNYIKKHYKPQNTIIAISGNITEKQADELVLKYFESKFKAKNLPNLAKPAKQLIKPAPSKVFRKRKIAQQNVMIMFPAISSNDDRRYGVSLLREVFAGDMSSRLFLNIREKLGLVYTISGGIDLTPIGGNFYIYFSCTPKNTKRVIDAVKLEVQKLVAGGVLAEELEKVKKIKRTNRLFASESVEGVNLRNAESIAEYNKITTDEEYLKIIDAITVDDLNGLAREIFKLENAIYACVGGAKV